MTRNRHSPSDRWTREHGFRRSSMRYGQEKRRVAGGKRVYVRRWRAWLKCRQLNWQYRDSLEIYECRWGENYRDGETAQPHWHLGHSGSGRSR